MIHKIPDKYFLVCGNAEGPSFLNSFDNALLAAGIGNTNLIRISSILPPGACEISATTLPYGSFVPIAYAHESSDVTGELVAAAVAVGVSEKADRPGVIMEYHHKGPAKTCEEKARHLVHFAFDSRGYALKEIRSVAAETKVVEIATAFAGVVLWN